MREQRHRHPVARIQLRSGPSDACGRQPGLSQGIVVHIQLIVQVDEIVVRGACIDCEDQCGQTERNGEIDKSRCRVLLSQSALAKREFRQSITRADALNRIPSAVESIFLMNSFLNSYPAHPPLAEHPGPAKAQRPPMWKPRVGILLNYSEGNVAFAKQEGFTSIGLWAQSGGNLGAATPDSFIDKVRAESGSPGCIVRFWE